MRVLLERDPELDRLRERRDQDGPGGVVAVEAPAGLGKTTLLRAFAEESRRAGHTVTHATAHPLESALTFGVMRQLVAPLLGTAPPGARRLLLPLLDGQGAGDELELAHAAYRACAEGLRSGPTRVLVVDDVQWSDRGSLLFLLYLAQRVPQHRLLLVCAHRSGESAVDAELLGRLLAGAGETLALAPLTPVACARLVRRRHDEASDAFCAEATRLSAGNPLLLAELVDEAARRRSGAGLPPPEELSGLTSVSLRRSVGVRLAAEGPQARALAEAVAVLGNGCSPHAAAALAGLDPASAAAAADRLVDLGLLRHEGSLRLTHPLVAAAVEGDLRPGRLAEHHRRSAEIRREEGAGPEVVSAHLLRATATGDPRAVDSLRAAARFATSTGATGPAVAYLRRALAEPPPVDHRPAVLLELAEAEVLDGRDEGPARLAEARGTVPGTPEGAALLRRLGDTLFRSGKYDEAASVFAQALQSVGSVDAELQSRVAACRTALEMLVPGAAPPDPSVLEGAVGSSRFLSVHLSLVAVMSCASHEAARDHALRALDEGAMLTETGIGLDYLVALGCLVWADELQAADLEVARGLRHAERHGRPLHAAQLQFRRSWIRHGQGDLETAVESARAAIEPWEGGWTGQVHIARFWCATSLLELGKLDEAHEVLAASAGEEQTVDAAGAAMLEVARGPAGHGSPGPRRGVPAPPRGRRPGTPAAVPGQPRGAALAQRARGRSTASRVRRRAPRRRRGGAGAGPSLRCPTRAGHGAARSRCSCRPGPRGRGAARGRRCPRRLPRPSRRGQGPGRPGRRPAQAGLPHRGA